MTKSKKKMEIIHLTFSMRLGGIETMLVNIANEQAKAHHVSLMMLNDDYDESIISKLSPEVKLINIGRKLGTKNIFDIIKLNYKLYRSHADILHIHHPSLIMLLKRDIMHCKIIFTMHDVPLPEDLPWLPRFNHICAISKSVRQSLKENGYESHLVENGICFPDFEKKEYGNTSREFRIIEVGRLVMDKKGQDIAIKAVKNLVESDFDNIRFDIVGEGPDKEKLHTLIEETGMNHHVKLLGAKSQEWLHHHYKDYSLFIQPSRFEGFGLTVAEAIAAKVPVLVSNQEGPMEIIDNGKYGFSFKTGDVDDCANMIKKISNMDNLQGIADRAYHHASLRYGVERTARQYIEYYQEILK